MNSPDSTGGRRFPGNTATRYAIASLIAYLLCTPVGFWLGYRVFNAML